MGYEANWRVFRNNATFLAETVKERMNAEQFDYIIFALLDNSIYHALAENGDMLPPCRGIDGTYHMHGDLVVCSKLAQHSLFKSVRPLLDCAKGKGAALMAPLPRYILNACCGEEDHMPNRAAADFSQQLKTELRGVAANLRDFLYTGGYRKVTPDPFFAAEKMTSSGATTPYTRAKLLMTCLQMPERICAKLRPTTAARRGREQPAMPVGRLHSRAGCGEDREDEGRLGGARATGGGGNWRGGGSGGGATRGGGSRGGGGRGHGHDEWRWSRGFNRPRGGSGGFGKIGPAGGDGGYSRN
jgi:uncharacterized membrane protein YgcG